MTEATCKPASAPLPTWVGIPCRINLDQGELAPIEETSSPSRQRANEIKLNYSSRTDAVVFRLVKRDRLAFQVLLTRTSFCPVDNSTELAAAKMVSFVRESGTGAESSTMSFLLILV